MDDGGWLSTRNRKKVPQPQPKIQKRRYSTFKPKSFQISNSPPPKQLFTATKQSSLNDFFSTNEGDQLEVEVNLDDDSQSENSNQSEQKCKQPAISETEKPSEFRKSQHIRHNGKSETLSGRDRSSEDCGHLGEGKERNNQFYPDDAFEPKVIKRERIIEKAASGSPENIKSHEKIKKKSQEKHEDTENINCPINDRKITDHGTETEGGTDMVAGKYFKRKRCPSEFDCYLSPTLKQSRKDTTLSENDLKLSGEQHYIDFIEQGDRNEETKPLKRSTSGKEQSFTEYLGSDFENDGIKISQDIRVPLSCFSSQSLNLDSQHSELETANTLILDTHNDRLHKRFEDGDCLTLGNLQEEADTQSLEPDALSYSLTPSSQVEDADLVSDDISFSVISQGETLGRKYEQLVSSASLDLSSQNASFDIVTERTENSVVLEELQEDSQLSLTSSSLEAVDDYQSLQLP